MVSESELVNRLQDILRSSDIHTTTPASIRRQLEAEFGVTLDERKAFIREQIDNFLQNHFSQHQNDDVQEEQQEREENDVDDGIEEKNHQCVNVKQEENDENGSQVEEEAEEEESDGQRRKKQRSEKMDKNVKRKKSGFSKPSALSPQLQELIGVPVLARTEVVKRIWAYIREKNLQKPQDKRKIMCDKILSGIFQVDTVDMFKMNKLLTKHIWPIDTEEGYHNENEEEEKEPDKVKQEEIDDNACSNHEEEGEEGEEEEGEEGGGEEEEEEEVEQQKEESAATSKNQRSDKMDKNVKRKGSGFGKSCSLSPQLQELVGVPELARTEVVKKIWAYIKEKNLQNPQNRKKIICDKTLRGIFRVDTVDMFKMNKLLTKHIWPIDKEDASPVKSSQKGRQKRQERQDLDEPRGTEKRQKKQTSGFLAPIPLSGALVKFFGTGENALSRADVVKRMWNYIKENELQDPADRRKIMCDDRLKELFEVDSFNGFTITKLLSPHFIKTAI